MWGPEGPTVRETRPVTIDQLRAEAELLPEMVALPEFIGMYRDGDVLTYESVKNNHWAFSVYRGKRANGIEYTVPISVMMS